jgi:hypothetical protein
VSVPFATPWETQINAFDDSARRPKALPAHGAVLEKRLNRHHI